MIDIKANKLSNCTVLFDDGRYYLVKGEREGRVVLGQGWHKSKEKLGYLNQGEDLAFQIVPKFLEQPLLQAALEKLKHISDIPKRNKYIEAIKKQLEAMS